MPAKPVVIAAGSPALALDLLDRVDRLAERDARREIEGDRHGGLLRLAADRERARRRA